MNNIHLNLNNYRNRQNRTIAYALFITALVILTPFLFINALDKHLDNQEIMLCNSAKISRNQEYLNKCDCYYKTNEIKCLYKGEK